jgi:quinol-cytochrome oxidoreductase complex cytochrome b subunit
VHLAALHQDGSNNPLGIVAQSDKIAFFPYFFIKDTLSFIAFIIFFSFFVYYSPNTLGHPDNYIEGNAMVTPEHIVPEWYFLHVYAILKCYPHKILGLLALILCLVVIFKGLDITVVILLMLLFWLGAQLPSDIYLDITKIVSGFVYLSSLILSISSTLCKECTYVKLSTLELTNYVKRLLKRANTICN